MPCKVCVAAGCDDLTIAGKSHCPDHAQRHKDRLATRGAHNHEIAGSSPSTTTKLKGFSLSRLTRTPSRMVAAPSRLPKPTGERERDAQRRALKPWRKWYSTKRWAELRRAKLTEVAWRCEQTGILVAARHPAPDSPVLDHKIPHRGDPVLFWDPQNLQIVSKEWHDSVKQKIERAEH